MSQGRKERDLEPGDIHRRVGFISFSGSNPLARQLTRALPCRSPSHASQVVPSAHTPATRRTWQLIHWYSLHSSALMTLHWTHRSLLTTAVGGEVLVPVIGQIVGTPFPTQYGNPEFAFRGGTLNETR